MKMNGFKKAPRKDPDDDYFYSQTNFLYGRDHTPSVWPASRRQQQIKVELIKYDKRSGTLAAQVLDDQEPRPMTESNMVVELNLSGNINSLYGNIISINKKNNKDVYLLLRLVRNSKVKPMIIERLIIDQIDKQDSKGINPWLGLYNSKNPATPYTIILMNKKDMYPDYLQENLTPELQDLNDTLKDFNYIATVKKGKPEISRVNAIFENVSVKYQATVRGKMILRMSELGGFGLLLNNVSNFATTSLNAIRTGLFKERIAQRGISSNNIMIENNQAKFSSFTDVVTFVKAKLGPQPGDYLEASALCTLQMKDGISIAGFIEKDSYKYDPEKGQFTLTLDPDIVQPKDLDMRTCIGNIRIDIGTTFYNDAILYIATDSVLVVPESVFDNFSIKFSSSSSSSTYFYIKFRTDKKNGIFTKPIKTSASRYDPNVVKFFFSIGSDELQPIVDNAIKNLENSDIKKFNNYDNSYIVNTFKLYEIKDTDKAIFNYPPPVFIE